MIALLVGVALGAEPPPRPETLEPSGDECSIAVGLQPGDAAPCIGTLLGPADLRWYLTVEDHYEHLRGLYRVDTASLEHERDRALFERDWYAGELSRALEPVPLMQRPGVLAGIGVSVGVIVGLTASWSAAAGLTALEGG